MNNKILIAAAGSGKTTWVVKEALNSNKKILITTYTEKNNEEIIKKVKELNNGIIPKNIKIQSWYSFLIEHGVKPYQGKMLNKQIKGYVPGHKVSKYYISKENAEFFYLTKDKKMYLQLLSDFTFECNKKSNNAVIERISNIFETIFIDEVQDMAGYDLEIIKLLFATKTSIVLTGDPRQTTYSTTIASKNKKYLGGKIIDFIKKECPINSCIIDSNQLKNSWRNNQKICEFANKLFPEYEECLSLQTAKEEHVGLFYVREKDVDLYLQKYSAIQLRYDSKTTNIRKEYECLNFGESKGLTFDRVLIYPNDPINKYLQNDVMFESFQTKCKFYVAVTRAKFSVGIVCKNNLKSEKFPFFNE
ncbi:DNA helicase II [Mesoplasma florum]|uniref:UvrD-helicase domain-containing protein n=1 Tax=Mesoplasma florum TaxID=2151 RepID=UPI000BE2BEA7|nr:UvrD-helicase domain-containing protein [Mesoplasma florum]ATI73400.1 DNA helicase II [Mesoplasma florum]AVN61800.1 DNA helicase II [Mesoplasma florum]AVN65171.1 DNA helicase II [Mesoplasma florum]